MIYHVTTRQEWQSKINESEFVPGDYVREGFIHCCAPSQLSGVLERYFKGRTGLVLIELDDSKLKAQLKYEASTNNEMFPHLYGGINRDAVTKVEEL